MFNKHGAVLNTGTAGGAGKSSSFEMIPPASRGVVVLAFLPVDCLALVFDMLLELLNHNHRIELFAGVKRRAVMLAARTLGAGVGIQQLFPAQVLHLRRAEGLGVLVFHVQRIERAFRLQLAEEHI